MKRILVTLVSIFALATTGCSDDDSTTTPTDSGTADTGGGGDTGGGDDTGGGGDDTGAPTDTGGGDPDDACGAEATDQACQLCCAENHMDAYQAFVTALITCACQDGVCDTQCGSTACASPPANPDATCGACLNSVQGSGGACVSAIQTACTGSGACVPFAACVQAQCAGKS